MRATLQMQKVGLPFCTNKTEKNAQARESNGNVFIRTIAKFLKVSARSIFVWVKTFAKSYAKSEPTNAEVIIELGEMWHFLDSKKTSLDLKSLL